LEQDKKTWITLGIFLIAIAVVVFLQIIFSVYLQNIY
jgi:hypothetical protein